MIDDTKNTIGQAGKHAKVLMELHDDAVRKNRQMAYVNELIPSKEDFDRRPTKKFDKNQQEFAEKRVCRTCTRSRNCRETRKALVKGSVSVGGDVEELSCSRWAPRVNSNSDPKHIKSMLKSFKKLL